MTIYSQEMQVPPPQPMIPQGWAPQMMPPMQIVMAPQPAAQYWQQPQVMMGGAPVGGGMMGAPMPMQQPMMAPQPAMMQVSPMQ